MSAPVIKVENLRVGTARRPILEIDSLSVSRGEILALMGPNGAGKTTFLRSLLGFQRCTASTLEVLSQRLSSLSWLGFAKLRQAIGYMPQLLPPHSQMPLTVREVVAIGRTGAVGLFRPLRREDWQIVGDWLERLGLADLAERAYSEISGGEQRKTLLARAMVQQPEMLFLDEPTANLDLGWRERIVATIQDLHEQTGVTVVLVCHELEVIPPGCRHAVILDRGRVIAWGEPAQVFTDHSIQALYGTGLTVLHQDGRHAVVPTKGTR